MIVQRVRLAHVDYVEIASSAFSCPAYFEVEPPEVTLGVGVRSQEKVIGGVSSADYHIQVTVFKGGIKTKFIWLDIWGHTFEFSHFIFYWFFTIFCEKAVIKGFSICETVKLRKLKIICSLLWPHIIFMHLK